MAFPLSGKVVAISFIKIAGEKRINIPFHGDKILHPKYVKEIYTMFNLVP